MAYSDTPRLYRLLKRRETAALLEAFRALAPEVELALFGADGCPYISVGEWSPDALQEAGSRVPGSSDQEAGTRIDDRLFLYPLLAGPYLAGALVARSPEQIDPLRLRSGQARWEHAVRCLHRSLATLVAQSMEKRAIARETLERYRELNLLYNTSETIISCLDAQILPELVMQEGSRTIRSDAGALFLVNPESGELELRASHNLALDSTPARLAREGAHRAIVVGQACIENDLPATAETAWVRALLSVPLKTRDQVLGTIVLLRGGRQGIFTAGEKKLLNALATQTAIALENARLYALIDQALERREDQLSTVEEIARELNATLNLERVLDLVVRRSLEATGAERGVIALIEDDSTLQIVSQHGFEGGLPPQLQASVFQLAGRAIETGQAAVAPDVPLVVPILLEERPLGAILLANSPRGFGPENEAFISHLAAHAATAIHNARLYEKADQERSKLATILTGTSEAIVVTDEQQRVLLLNPAAQVFFSVPPSQVVGQALEEAVAGSGLVALLRKAIAQGHALTGEVVSPVDTTFYAGVSPVPGVGWVIVMQNISYLKELDELRSEFLATASHDLKSPIGLIMGYAGMVAEFGELNETQRDCLDEIVKASQSMTRLINDLLDVVRIEAGFVGEMERCDLGMIVREGVSQLRHQARAKLITMRERIPRSLPSVQGNPHRLAQVVANLLSNAIKYTPTGGRINVTARAQRGEVTVTVEDNGIGIAPEHMVHVFERFYRVPGASQVGAEGTGLGLSICKSIVEKHGGRIWGESEEGRGSAFRFALPAVGG